MNNYDAFMCYARDNYGDNLVKNSEYFRDDNLTFVFKTKDGNSHELTFDPFTKSIEEQTQYVI